MFFDLKGFTVTFVQSNGNGVSECCGGRSSVQCFGCAGVSADDLRVNIMF